jgi:large subunit ribosomal protein L22
MMEAIAKAKYIRQSARKVRHVLDLVRELHVEKALNILHFSTKKASVVIEKTIRSAVANAVNAPNSEINADNLYITTAFCDEGPTMKRFRPRAMGRATVIRRRSSHLTIVVAEKK